MINGNGSERSNHFFIHFIVAVILLVLGGGYVLTEIIQFGKVQFNTNNEGIFWGFPIVVYDYFLLTSTGLAMVAALYHVFGLEEFRSVANRCLWLAFAGIAGGVTVLFLELGNPWVALWATPLNLQTASPLFWKVLLVAAYAFLLVLVLLGSIRNRDSRRNPLMIAVGALALAITLVAGAVYGMMAMRPVWFGGEVPVVFLIESFMGGLAFTIFFTHLAYGFNDAAIPSDTRSLFRHTLPRMFAISIALHFALHAGRAATGLWTNAEGFQVWHYMVSQPLFHIALWGCVALPFILMVLPATRARGLVQAIAALLVMIGLLISRYEFIIGGQMVPLFKGTWVQGLLSYSPSVGAWALLVLAVGLANAVYAFAAWKLGAEEDEFEPQTHGAATAAH
ncbi:MAG: NrfD/PsrC family molybdoenzyme membrane anchor subunit [Gammaproteobacteria bacterium]|nr:NrfD/PsrC family molybdoenzyme membrane anchor subunit [Gammaproteobacteria bacterium]